MTMTTNAKAYLCLALIFAGLLLASAVAADRYAAASQGASVQGWTWDDGVSVASSQQFGW